MKNKKGFTLIELLVSFIIMAFLLGIGVVSYRFIIDRVAANYYNTLEEELLLAGSDYFTNHREDKPLSGYSAVYIDELVDEKYIETLKDRNGKVCSASNDSKVYIYKTEKGYDYEVCLVCNDYKTKGTYCDGIAMGVINISAVKEDGTSYNPLLSYENNSWSNSDVTVTFSVNVPVSEFVITNTKNGTKNSCTDINDKSCSMVFNETSTYNVKAYNEGVEVAPEKGFNIKIDKTSPVCSFISGPTPNVIDKNSTSTYVLKCTDSHGFSDYSISASDLTPSTTGVLTIQTPSVESITDGYRYTIVVTGTGAGNAKLTLTAGAVKDKAGNGNSSIVSNELQINTDEEAPNISYNLAAGTYTTNKTVRVTVTDNNEIASISYKLYKDGTLVTSGNPTITSPTSVSFSKSLNSNGTWKLDVVATDNEGNQASETRSFTINKDEEAPKVNYSLSGSTVYTENKTVVVTVTDNRELSSVTYELYKDNNLVSSGSPEITSPSSVVFSEDLDSNGVWKLDVIATDESGNETEATRSFEIQVDGQAPNISYDLPSGTYQENKTVKVTVTDDIKIVSVEYTLYKNGVEVSSESPTITSDTSVSFSKNLNSDGVWTLDVTATDDSGNETEATRSFTINKDDEDPNISYDLAAGTYKDYKTVTVTVTDNKQLLSVEYSLYKDGTLITLGDPVITNATKVEFSNDLDSNGTWKLDVTATDANGNTATNSRTFTIDRDNEAPQISYDLATGTYDENKTVKVTVTDNSAISSVEYWLYKDNSLVSSGSPEITSSTKVSFSNDLDSNGVWKLDVKAIDENGNETNATRTFTINKDDDAPTISYNLASATYVDYKTVTVTVTDNSALSSIKYELYKDDVLISSGSPEITSPTMVSFSKDLDSNGVWKLDVTAVDEGGNETNASRTFTIKRDNEAPTISYDLAAGTYEENKTVNVTVKDNQAISSVQYKLYKDDVLISSGSPEITTPSWVEFANDLDSNGVWRLDVTATDNDGNQASATRSFTISKDEEAPKVNYSLSGSTVYTENKTVVVTVTDNRELSSVEYWLYKDGSLVSSGSPEITSPSSVVFNEDLDSNGVWKMDVTAIDAAGNRTDSSRSFEIQVDSQAPKISYDLPSGTYQENKTVTVTVTDDKKISSVEYILYKDGESVSSGSPTITSDTSVSFSKDLNSDGVWTLDVTATDDSGNKTEATRSFIINKDDEAPNISYDLAAGKYIDYKTVTVTVTDNKQLLSVEYSLYKDGTLITLGDPVITNATKVEFSNDLNSNGTWKLDVTATDANGNTTNDTRTFTIDRDNEDPVITYDLAAGTYYENKTVKVTVTDNRAIDSVEYWLYKDGSLVSSGSPEITSPSWVSFSNDLDSNGTWKLEVKAVDEEGNEANATRTFTIDRDNEDPKISYDLAAGTYYENKTVKVTVTDNRAIDSVEYWLYKDGSLVSSGSPTITSNTSVSFSNDLDSNGTWKLDVKAVDEEGNEANATRTFTIDRDNEDPKISYDLAAGTYEENKTVKVTVTDNRAIDSVEYWLYKDGSLVSSGSPTITSNTSVSFSNDLNSNGEWQLDVKAVDEEGNEANATRSFTINTLKCEWVWIAFDSPKDCTPIEEPTNPTKGDRYVTCDGPIWGNWRYKLGPVSCADGTVVNPGVISGFDYDTSNRAGLECQTAYQNTIQACNQIGSTTVGGVNCTTEQTTFYNKYTYEYQCE